MLREFWPAPVCALPDLWEKTTSSCALYAKNSHTSFFFLQPCCSASDSGDVSAGSHHSERKLLKRAALWVQTKGPSSTALLPAQSQVSSPSKSRNKEEQEQDSAHSTSPLDCAPSSEQCVLRGFLSSVSFVESVACRGSQALQGLAQLHLEPASAFGPQSIHESGAAQGTSSCSEPGYGSLPLWAPGFLCLKKYIFPKCLCLWWFPVLTHNVVHFPNCAVLN